MDSRNATPPANLTDTHKTREHWPILLGVFTLLACCGFVVLSQSPRIVRANDGPSAIRTPVVAAKPAETSETLYDLQLKFQIGQTVFYDVSHSAEITTQKGETKETAHNTSDTRKHYRVISVDSEGGAVLESYLDSVKMSYHFNDQTPVTFDSESAIDAPKGFGHIRDSIGRPLSRAEFDKHGQLITITALWDNDPDGETGASDDPLRNFLIPLPESPVAIGHSWDEKLPVKVRVSKNLSNKVTLLRTYVLQSVEDGLATISVKSKILTPVDDPKIRAQLIQRTPHGTIVLDLNQGLIVSRSMTTNQTEIGVLGSESAMRAKSRLAETLVAPTAVADESANSASSKNN